MGTRFQNVKRRKKRLGARGKLIGRFIDELWIYYSVAIRKNSDCIAKIQK